MSRPESGHNTGLAVLWMMLALACFCLLAIASRELTASLGTLEILFWRSLLGWLIVVTLLLRSGGLGVVRMPRRILGWHFMRNSSHFFAQCAWLIAIAALPLAEVFAIEFTTPLWAALLAALFMGEPLSRGRWISLVLGLVGVLFILRPGSAAINPASLILLAGAVGFGLSAISTRRLTQLLPDNPQVFLVILFYMTGMQACFSLVPIVTALHLPDSVNWIWLLAAATTALGAHYCLSRALSLADAAVVMPLDYLRLPLIMLLAWLIYGETVSLSLLAGSALIVAGNAAGLYLEARRLKARAYG
ncbi:DMT family transporter [Seongchinamella sediminis]|uniref:DMT family transporter n=1 Tax=Seongchinamella sediminis TaxID=2283635 RepID=UPI001058A8DE|nr:DMT family transporter [Seongchinamella sediminis]